MKSRLFWVALNLFDGNGATFITTPIQFLRMKKSIIMKIIAQDQLSQLDFF